MILRNPKLTRSLDTAQRTLTHRSPTAIHSVGILDSSEDKHKVFRSTKRVRVIKKELYQRGSKVIEVACQKLPQKRRYHDKSTRASAYTMHPEAKHIQVIKTSFTVIQMET